MVWVRRLARTWAAALLFGLLAGSVSAESWKPIAVDDLVARYPSREPNAAALKVERLTAEIGIDIATRSAEGRYRPTEAATDAYHPVKRELNRYLKRQLELADSELEPPPDEMTDWLASHAAELDALREQLIRGGTPLWESQMELLYQAPVPNLMGHIELQRLLHADALARLEAGDPEGALADLEASWRLNAAFQDDPILMTQLVRLTIIRMQVGALRHVEHVPAVWSARLADLDVRGPMMTAMELEGWVLTQVDDSQFIAAESNLLTRALLALSGPYVRMCINESHADWMRKLANLSRLEYFCDRDLAEVDADLQVSPAWWNTLGEKLMPNLDVVPHHVARLELDVELTRKLLRLRAARDENGGSWPDDLDRLSQSRACPDDRWVYEVTGDGGMSIELDRDVEWPRQVGTFLPTRYSSDQP